MKLNGRQPTMRKPAEKPIELIGFKEAAKILGLAPKTVANGGAGTIHLQRRIGPSRRIVRYIRSEVIALRDEWLNVNDSKAPNTLAELEKLAQKMLEDGKMPSLEVFERAMELMRQRAQGSDSPMDKS